jgi:short-subunit dehydrogenase
MGQWVLITGASSGIGWELAKVYAEAGCDLVLCARRKSRLEALAETLRPLGRRVEVLSVDLGKRRAPAKLVARLAAMDIEVDVLVNNAGTAEHGAFTSLDPDALDAMVAVNVRALTALTRHLLPGMLARGAGRILNIASVAAFQPVPALAAYAASKAYVLSFSEALSEELRGTGVTVTALCPGLTRTEMLSDLPDLLRPLVDAAGPAASGAGLATFLRDALVQDARAVALEGREASERGDAVRVTGWLNAWAAAWSEVQPRWLLRALGGFAGRMAMARSSDGPG